MDYCEKHGPYSVLCRYCDVEDLAAFANTDTTSITEKRKMSKNVIILDQAELIDKLYDVVELVTSEYEIDAVNSFKLLHRQGYVLSDKQMEFAESLHEKWVERGIL